MIFQEQMLLCATTQANYRAKREGQTCIVYKQENHPEPGVTTWYVRTVEEGKPEGAEIVLVTDG